MIRNESSEKSGRHARIRLEKDRRVTNDDHRVLVLETPIWQLHREPAFNRPFAIREPVELQGVRRKRRAFAQ